LINFAGRSNGLLKYLLIWVVVVTAVLSCTQKKGVQSDQQHFVSDLKQLKTEPVYHEVLTAANQQLRGWYTDSLQETLILGDCHWKIDDAVFMNSARTRCLLLLILQDKQADAELDYVYQLYAALEKGRWILYFVSMPNMVYPRSRFSTDKFKPVELAKLAEISRAEMLKDYYLPDGSVNDAYVNSLYTEELKIRQQIFLHPKRG